MSSFNKTFEFKNQNVESNPNDYVDPEYTKKPLTPKQKRQRVLIYSIIGLIICIPLPFIAFFMCKSCYEYNRNTIAKIGLVASILLLIVIFTILIIAIIMTLIQYTSFMFRIV